VEGAALHVAATVTNAGDHPMPFSFGYHPPLPGRCRAAPKEAHRIVFAKDEPAARPPRQQGAGQVVPEKQATPVVAANWRSICVRADAVIWDRWPAAALSYGADGGAWLDIAFPDTPRWGVAGARRALSLHRTMGGPCRPGGLCGRLPTSPASSCCRRRGAQLPHGRCPASASARPP
jgi:hypothetical protein